MFPVTTILHPTDFSWYSEHAFQLACSLAREHHARVLVLYVVPTPPPDIVVRLGWDSEPMDCDDYRGSLWADLWRIESPEPDVLVERRLEEGDAAAAILRVAQETGAELIVLGTHGCTGLANPPMRRVAEQVRRQATCPVVTVEAPPPVAVPAVKGVDMLSVDDPWLDVGGEG